MPARLTTALAASFLAASLTSAIADDASIDNPNNCRIVEREPGLSQGQLSASVTAGNGKTTAHTSGGSGVTVQSGNGSVSSSVSTTGSGQTMVTTSNGDCTIYVTPGEKKEK